MVRAYGLLLRFYPLRYRAEFADEMLSVFAQSAKEHRVKGPRAYARFLLAESGGVLVEACRERSFGARFAPILGGLGIAALLQWIFYSGVLRVLGAVESVVRGRAISPADPLADALTMSMFGVATLLCLLPLFLLLGMRLMRPRS